MLSGVLQEYFLIYLEISSWKQVPLLNWPNWNVLWLQPEKSASVDYTGFLT